MVPYVITAEHTEVAVPLGKLFLDRHAISVLCGLSVTQPALADIIHYECKADLSTGYHFDEKTRAWSPTNFIPKGKYVIRKLSDEELKYPSTPKGSTWGVFNDEYKTAQFGCPEPATSVYLDGLRCGYGGEFQFNAMPLRYQTYYVGGYVHGRDNNDDTPYIEIGRCKEIYGK
jgi:hypothetical protein